jgi:molybdate/tungstate transport system permease protein
MKIRYLFILPGIFLILFLAYPLIKMIFNVDPGILLDTVKEKEVIDSVILTLRASFYSTVAALFTGIPLGYLFARKEFPGKKILEGLIDIPVIIPHTAVGIALLSAWGRNSVIYKVTGINIVGTETAISIAMFFVSVPFLINSVKSGFRMIDPRYEKTALTLGASPWQMFRTISLPMVKKSVISGSIMMWGRGISEFGAIIILAYHPLTAPVVIFERFQNFGLKYALPVTLIMILISLLIFVVMRVYEAKK